MTYQKRSLAVIFFLTVCFTSFAQKQDEIATKLQETPNISVTEMDQKIMGDRGAAHTVSFVADADAVMDAWRDYCKDEMDQKLKKSKGLYSVENFMFAEISSGPISLYSDVVMAKEGAQLQVWVKSGEQYVSHKDHPDISSNLDKFIRNFAVKFYKDYFDEVIDNQEDKLKDASKALSGIVKDKEKMTDDIEDNKKQIEKNKDDIVDAEKEIKELQEKIEEMKKENENLAKENEDLQKKVKDKTKEVEAQQKVVEEQKKQVENIKASSSKIK
ncbi:zinc ribbon domain-containing protein [Halocola ammonii]